MLKRADQFLFDESKRHRIEELIIKTYFNSMKQTFWLWLSSELSERMLQNLPFIKINHTRIFLSGSFEAKTIKAVHQTYPQAILWTNPVKQSSFKKLFENLNVFNKNKIQYLNNQEKVLVQDIDLLWAGPLKMDANKMPKFFEDAALQLKTQGLMMFNYLGPDTAKEYWSLLTQMGNIGPDMHDIGDALIKSGFADPVMNMEYVDLEYETSQLLMKDLYEMGLLSESELISEELKIAFDSLKKESPKMKLTLEVVYGHAWKVPKKEPGITRIPADQILKTYKK